MARDEVFGPVLAIQSARDFEEALRLANDVQFGLTASIYSRDYFTVMRFVERSSGDSRFHQHIIGTGSNCARRAANAER